MKSGTVRLPYPPPASGRLYLGIDPDAKGREPGMPAGPPRFFLRIVHRMGPGESITRIVPLAELRGISLPPEGRREGGHQAPGRRVFRPADQLADAIAEAIAALEKAAEAGPGIHEVCLFEDAAIYVPEAAPVFLRIVYEHGLTAAEAAEHAPRLLGTGHRNCDCTQTEPPVCEEP